MVSEIIYVEGRKYMFRKAYKHYYLYERVDKGDCLYYECFSDYDFKQLNKNRLASFYKKNIVRRRATNEKKL